MSKLIEVIQEYLDDKRPDKKGTQKVTSVNGTHGCGAIVWIEGKNVHTGEPTRYTDRINVWSLLVWSHNKNK